jgi:tRNA pseudouridine38-40 synthase
MKMARYQVILAYDGTQFLGSQRQASSRTVQGELEKALSKLGWDGQTVYLAGRTDTGTHASGQVAAFDLEWGHGLDDLQKALNTHLPHDMAVREVKVAANAFHPRFDASSRRYRYRLFCAGVRDPLRERYAWRVWPAVTDLTPLAAILPGEHNFASFGTPPRTEGSTVRTVLSAEWQNCGDEWIFDIQADAFLYRMVRRLVYVQVAVGQGRLLAETLVWALEKGTGSAREVRKGTQSRIPASLAPASGLTLVEVCYANLV